MAVGRAHEAFSDDGKLKDEKLQGAVLKIGSDLAALTLKLKS